MLFDYNTPAPRLKKRCTSHIGKKVTRHLYVMRVHLSSRGSMHRDPCRLKDELSFARKAGIFVALCTTWKAERSRALFALACIVSLFEAKSARDVNLSRWRRKQKLRNSESSKDGSGCAEATARGTCRIFQRQDYSHPRESPPFLFCPSSSSSPCCPFGRSGRSTSWLTPIPFLYTAGKHFVVGV